MKSYTDIEQSEKLAEILPIESADMSWVSNGLGKPFARTISIKGDPEELCACWSLAALLDVLDRGASFKTSQGWACQVYIGPKAIISNYHSNPIDACVEIISELHKQKLI